MGMGWHTLAHPYESEGSRTSRPCKCGKGLVYTFEMIDEESEYPPFERGYTATETTCPDRCEG